MTMRENRLNHVHLVYRPPWRRPVLGLALLAGVIAAALLAPSPSTEGPAADLAAPLVTAAQAQAPGTAAPPSPPSRPAPPPVPPAPGTSAAPATPDGSGGPDRSVDAEITIDGRGVIIHKGGRKDSASAQVIIGDHEFDSFEEFVHQAPWLAGLVFMVTAMVFLVPLLIIVLVIWYKMRRARMMNETMLKLAERGVVPPADALDAVATGRPGPALQAVPPTAPYYEQAQQLRKRVAWSDLRKGVLIGGFGLGLTFFSILDDGSANGLGLVLLFVGIGYAILWYFEERPALAARSRAAARRRREGRSAPLPGPSARPRRRRWRRRPTRMPR